MEQIKTMPTFTNCVSGALGSRDVVIRILGSLSDAFAYSSSICVLGTKILEQLPAILKSANLYVPSEEKNNLQKVFKKITTWKHLQVKLSSNKACKQP